MKTRLFLLFGAALLLAGCAQWGLTRYVDPMIGAATVGHCSPCATFPLGKIEAGESPKAALVREIREELAAEVSVEKLLRTIEWDYPKFHLKMHCYMCSLRGAALHLNEHEAARWLSAADLPSVSWLPADLQLLPLISRELGG